MRLLVIGHPLGGIVGGLFVQRLLATATWHEVFLYGAWATTGLLPLVWLLVPESVAFLDRRRPPGALERINRILVRFGHPPVSVLSEASPGAERRSIADLFKPGLVTTTVLITFVYFAHITSFYFIIKWVPKIVVDMGFEPRAAAGVLTWANVGGAVGGAIFGLIATRLGLKALTLCVLLATSVMIVWFGHGSADLASLKTTLAITGLFTNSAIAGLYLLFAQVFPTHVRAESGLVALVVEKLLHAAVPPVRFIVPVERFLGADEVVLRAVIGHLAHAPHRVLGGLERLPILHQQLFRHLGHPLLQPVCGK